MNLKPQDVLILLKLVAQGDMNWVYSRLAMELSMSSSEIHAAMKRAHNAGLMIDKGETIMPDAKNLEEFIVYGLKYAFAAERGDVCIGIPTSYAAKPLCDRIISDDANPPVWPDDNGKVQGIAFRPLYPSVPDAVRVDSALYELLALIDAIRGGRARERTVAIKEIKLRFMRYANQNRLGYIQHVNRRRKTG
ncbi:MAG: hypothetical protein R8G33_03930 [Gammaproteobacteria bacterium]|nr:hypothetical protein [Gammaproteobacteria bacterium]